MVKKIEVKVNMHCEKCKTQVLKSVTKLSGIDQISVNMEKQMLVVVGDVDPVSVAARVRKIGKIPEIVSVGPPKKPEPKPDYCPIVCGPPICYDAPRAFAVGYLHPCEHGRCGFL